MGPGHVRARATMRDVAALAGVGLKTVSRVVNGEKGVSPELTDRVTRAAQQLNYQPDMTAGNLRRSGRRSSSLGLLLASVDNPFAAAVHRAVENVAESRGVAVFSASTDEHPDRERRLVTAFISRRVDGLIITGTGIDQRYLLPEIQAGTPVVMIDRPAVGIDVDTVMTDNVASANTATTHLITHGHRRIAFLGDLSRIATATQRLAGFQLAMSTAELPIDRDHVVLDQHDEHTAFATMVRLANSPTPPTAVFASQNIVTVGVIRALRALGLHHRIALVGFDDFLFADLLDPAITVMAQDPVLMGRMATERVFARLANVGLLPELMTVPARLVARGSGEIAPQ